VAGPPTVELTLIFSFPGLLKITNPCAMAVEATTAVRANVSNVFFIRVLCLFSGFVVIFLF